MKGIARAYVFRLQKTQRKKKSEGEEVEESKSQL